MTMVIGTGEQLVDVYDDGTVEVGGTEVLKRHIDGFTLDPLFKDLSEGPHDLGSSPLAEIADL